MTTTKELFFIDFHSGAPIFLGVENGIFTGCYGESRMELVMNEKYVGKTISFLKKDFEATMKPSWACVRPHQLCNSLLDFQLMQSNLHNLIVYQEEQIRKKEELTAEQLATRKKLEDELALYKEKIEGIKTQLKEIHGYEN